MASIEIYTRTSTSIRKVFIMSISDKLRKIKDKGRESIFKIGDFQKTEKTGVVNSLLLLGSVGAFIVAIEHEVQAVTCDSKGEITDTNLNPVGPVIDDSAWKNHCWNWSWCWCWSHTWDNSASSS